jgi:hypothetical protein
MLFSRSKRRGKTGVPTDASRQLAVYKNPFTTATTNGKIPDGKSMISTGFRHQESFQINEQGDSGLTIYMYPGLQTGIEVDGGGQDTRTSDQQFYSNGVVVDNSGNQTADWVTQWRIVSQGLKLSLVNSDETNDGWWEAVRVHVPASQGEFEYADGRTFTGADFPYKTTGNLANSPTYVSGSLKDIHKHLFVLAPASREHEFLRLEKNGNTDVRKFIDDSHDCIVIKIYGNVGSNTLSRLHAHHVCNQEYIYGHDTKQHQQQTKSYDYPGALRTASRSKKAKLFRAAVGASAMLALGAFARRRLRSRAPIRRRSTKRTLRTRGTIQYKKRRMRK